MRINKESRDLRVNPYRCYVVVALACLSIGHVMRSSMAESTKRRKAALRIQALEGVKKMTCNDSIDAPLKELWDSLDSEPILTQDQGRWILETVRKANPSNPKLLVFGVGYDSSIWTDLNTCGTSVFLENSQVWMDMVLQRYSYLLVHLVQYQQKPGVRVGTADKFLKEPYIMTMPKEVQDECFDVVLVDAPMGWRSFHPGRMEAAYWSLKMAQRCAAKNNKPVHVFVHDAQRNVEHNILEQMYLGSSDGAGAVVDSGSMEGRPSMLTFHANFLRMVTFEPPK